MARVRAARVKEARVKEERARASARVGVKTLSVGVLEALVQVRALVRARDIPARARVREDGKEWYSIVAI